jgi:hypothetical protein
MTQFWGSFSFNIRLKLGRLVIVIRLEPKAAEKAEKPIQ